MKTVNFYYYKKTLEPFLLVLSILYSLFLFRQVYGLVPLIETVEIDVGTFMMLVLLNMPALIIDLTPIVLAIAVYISTNNSSMQSEFVGLQSLGVNLNTVLRVVFKIGLIAGCLLVISEFYIVPKTNYYLLSFKHKLFEQSYKLKLLPQSINSLGNNILFFDSNEGDAMKNILLITDDKIGIVILARKAVIEKLSEDIIELNMTDGSLMVSQGNNRKQLHRFEQASFPLQINKQRAPIDDFLINEDKWSDINYLKNKHRSLLTVEDYKLILQSAQLSKADKHPVIMAIFSKILLLFNCLAFSVFAFGLGINNPRFPVKGHVLMLILGLAINYQLLSVAKRIIVAELLLPPLMYIVPLTLFGIGLFFYYFANQNRPVSLFSFAEIGLYRLIVKKFFTKKNN